MRRRTRPSYWLAPIAVVVTGASSLAMIPSGGTAAQTPPPLEDGDAAAQDEGADRAVPSAEAQSQVAHVIEDEPTLTRDVATTNDATATAVAGEAIEDFLYDDLETEGRAGDICHGSLRRGTALTYNRLVSMFGGSSGTMYTCRERWALNEDPDCDGQVVNPVTNPDFETDCWSNHAQGRAWDLMVGTSGGGYNVARGDAIVNWLLAPDAYGNQNANARRLGVQQLLWDNKCWNSDGDRGVASASAMRVCGYGHYDHIHGDMTLAGAEAQVSFWGVSPAPPAPKMNGLTTWDVGAGGYTAQEWTNLRNEGSATGRWPSPWDKSATGDLDADGVSDDQFLYSTSTGDWQVMTWNDLQPTIVATGRWTPIWDQLGVGDFDADGRMNEMLIRDTQTGQWQVQEWTSFTGRRRTSGTELGSDWTEVIVGDWDSDGIVDDTYHWNRITGQWQVDSWYRFAPTTRRNGRFSTAWDQVIPGDWDAQGNFDDMFMWDAQTGGFAIYGWGNVSLVRIVPGQFSMTWDQFTAADLDTDGRIDDMVMWDRHSGAVDFYSWRRDVPTGVARRTWSTRWDQFLVGTWG